MNSYNFIHPTYTLYQHNDNYYFHEQNYRNTQSQYHVPQYKQTIYDLIVCDCSYRNEQYIYISSDDETSEYDYDYTASLNKIPKGCDHIVFIIGNDKFLEQNNLQGVKKDCEKLINICNKTGTIYVYLRNKTTKFLNNYLKKFVRILTKKETNIYSIFLFISSHGYTNSTGDNVEICTYDSEIAVTQIVSKLVDVCSDLTILYDCCRTSVSGYVNTIDYTSYGASISIFYTVNYNESARDGIFFKYIKRHLTKLLSQEIIEIEDVYKRFYFMFKEYKEDNKYNFVPKVKLNYMARTLIKDNNYFYKLLELIEERTCDIATTTIRNTLNRNCQYNHHNSNTPLSHILFLQPNGKYYCDYCVKLSKYII